MRPEIYSMWAIQENLLQQYRIIAVTLMGLISAGILVAVSQVRETLDKFENLFDRFPAFDRFDFSSVIVLTLLITLLILGTITSWKMRNLTNKRGRIVTFYQNLLIAEECEILQVIAERHEIAYPVELLRLHRKFVNIKSMPLSFEPGTKNENVSRFINEIMQIGGHNEFDKERHDSAREFLKNHIYFVFNIFFFITACFVLLTLLAALGKI